MSFRCIWRFCCCSRGCSRSPIWYGPSPRFYPIGFPPKSSCRCSSFSRSAPSSAPPSGLASDGELGTGSNRSVFERIPGYGVIRSLTNQMAGRSRESTWRAALVEIEVCPCPGVHHRGVRGRALHRLRPVDPDAVRGCRLRSRRQRVHPVDVPFTDAIRVISRWGSGAKNLVAAMERGESVAPANSAASQFRSPSL